MTQIIKQETSNMQDDGTAQADQSASGADGTVSNQPVVADSNSEPTAEDFKALQAKLASAEKAKQNAELERNMLKNKQEEAELKRLEEAEEYKALAEKLKAEKEQRDQEDAKTKAEAEANTLRENLIAQRPEAVQKAAKALIEKNPNNLAWSDAADATDASEQLNAQLDALQEVLGVEVTKKDGTVIHANNPGNPPGEKPFEDLSLEEMEAVLPHADPR